MSIESTEPSGKWATAALRVMSESLETEQIGHIIGHSPSRAYEKGQPVSRRNPLRLSTQSVWILDSPLGWDQELATHLDWLASFAESHREALKQLATTSKMDLFCGLSAESGQGGAVLDRLLLARLSALALDVKIDLYPPGPITIPANE